MTVEQSTAPRGASRETQALAAEIYAMRRRFNAAVERRDQAADRVAAAEAQGKAQRWLKAEHSPHWYRQQLAREQRELTSAKNDLKLLGDQHDEMMERLDQAYTRDAVARINSTSAPVHSRRTPQAGTTAL